MFRKKTLAALILLCNGFANGMMLSKRNKDKYSQIYTPIIRYPDDDFCASRLTSWWLSEDTINARISRTGWTPLHYAAAYNKYYITKHLLANGADINAQTTTLITPLQLARSSKA